LPLLGLVFIQFSGYVGNSLVTPFELKYPFTPRHQSIWWSKHLPFPQLFNSFVKMLTQFPPPTLAPTTTTTTIKKIKLKFYALNNIWIETAARLPKITHICCTYLHPELKPNPNSEPNPNTKFKTYQTKIV